MSTPAHPLSGRQVLADAGALFVAGLGPVFPWILAAELLVLLPSVPNGGIFDTDSSALGDPGYLGRALLLGAAQALLYAMAVLRMDALAKEAAPSAGLWSALPRVPAVIVGYLCYEVIVIVGLSFTLAFFMLGFFIAGLAFGLVLCLLPLAPTAAASTALALFLFPAVLDGRGPFASLGESSRLAKTAWVKVSLVISVPAVALLAAAVVTDYPAISHAVSQGLELLRQAQEGDLSMQNMDGLLGSFKSAPSASRYDRWHVVGTVSAAFAWWYTLAVCYVQYRDLKDRAQT